MNLFEDIKNNYYHVEANPDEYPWVNNFLEPCPHCGGNVSVFFTNPEQTWAESKCLDCGRVIQPSIEVSSNTPEDNPDESSDYFEVYIENGDSSGIISISKSDGSRWQERVIDGDLDKNYFNKTYAGYLTKQDILKWLYQDNFDNLRLVEADLIREDLVKKANQIKELLSHYNSDAKVNYYDDGEDIIIDLSSGNFNPDSLSKYSNTIAFDGRIYFDNDLNIVNTDIKTSSGPNVLNKDFISALNALYTFVKSNGSHYDA